jgi:hypothetical protein
VTWPDEEAILSVCGDPPSFLCVAILPADTTRAARAAQIRAWRALGPAGRLELALSMSDDVRTLTADGIRQRHPEKTDVNVFWAERRRLLGADLFQKAYPNAPHIQP